MLTQVITRVRSKCDFCNNTADYDFVTSMGPWAYGCEKHYLVYRKFTRLGVGLGQKLIPK